MIEPTAIRGACLAMLGWTLAGAGVPLPAWSSDWPQFLGPHRDGTISEAVSLGGALRGPRVIASREVGAGFSGPVIAGGRVILHHRVGNDALIECWDAQDLKTVQWRHKQPTRYRDDFGFDNGPRAVPAIADGRVYAFGADGALTCLELSSGKLLWSVDTAERFGADKGFFGFACSPLVQEGCVLVNLGGRDDAGIAAFDAVTGALRWKSTRDEASYASPVAMTLGGKPAVLFFNREGLVVLDPRSGAVRGEFAWRSRQAASVNAATPLVLGERVFLTASYGTGAVLLDLRSTQPTPVWSGDDSLSSHYASVVEHEGYVFGFHGRQEYGASLRCVEAATGRVQWSEDGLGCGSILRAKDRLLVLTERGELILAKATPARFEALGRAQVLGTGCRAYPAFADGRFWARDPKKLVCLDLGRDP